MRWFTVALLLALTAPLALGASPHESSSTVVERRIDLWAPAVAQPQNGGPLVGTLVRLEVSMRTGSGAIYVETQPLTQLDMQGAARLAASIAGGLTGEDLSRWDFTFVMRADSPTVGGPSAGGLMTVAVLALLKDWEVRDDVIMTGMINPDGSIGPVGGIMEKAEAAAAANARLFLIPEGQATQVVTTVHVDNGVTTREQRVVNVAQEAWKQWNLEVREVTDVNDALEGLTGHRFEEPEASREIASQVYLGIMGPAASDGIAQARDRVDAAEQRFEGSGVGTSTALGQQLQSSLLVAAARIGRADDAYQNESYYSATSLVFQANVDLGFVEEALDHAQATDPDGYFQARARTTGEDLVAVARETMKFEPRTLSSLEALGASQQRILDAQELLQESLDLYAETDPVAALRSLAFAVERVNSVRWWLDLARELNDPRVSTLFDPETLPALASEILGSTLNTLTYADVLIEESGASGTAAGQLVAGAKENYLDALRAQAEDLDAGALFEALEAQARINVGLTLLGMEATSSEATRFVDRAREASLREIGRARGLGVEPVLAVSLHDFAATVLGDGSVVEALVLYHTARMVAKSAEFTLRPTGEATFVGFPQLRSAWDPTVVVAAGIAGFVFGGGLAAAVVIARSGSKREGPARLAHAPTTVTGVVPSPARNPRASVAPLPLRRRVVARRPRVG